MNDPTTSTIPGPRASTGTFTVMALGVGDTFTEKHHTTALLLEADGVRLAIDCPDTYRRVLADASRTSGRSISLADIDQVLITHVHGDHVNGLEGVAFWKHFVEQKKVELVTSPDVRSVLWDQRLRAPMERLWDGQRFHTLGFDDYFRFTPLAWGAPITVGPFTITSYRTKHHVPTSAVVVEACGRTLGYSADTAFDRELVDVLSAADLVVHETNYGPAHTPYEALATLPERIRRKLRLVHYPDQLDVARTIIPPLREGELVTV
ncbi:MBL fold metallo-hydrolase [Myxococcota bacterium]|nr:MBL fold metallo-hydrolase [Myxococcota bacterium]